MSYSQMGWGAINLCSPLPGGWRCSLLWGRARWTREGAGKRGPGQPFLGLQLTESPGPQFFVMLLLVFLLEVTIAVLFLAYTDQVQPPCPAPRGRPA